jgi:hypothetical protein
MKMSDATLSCGLQYLSTSSTITMTSIMTNATVTSMQIAMLSTDINDVQFHSHVNDNYNTVNTIVNNTDLHPMSWSSHVNVNDMVVNDAAVMSMQITMLLTPLTSLQMPLT